MARTALRHLVVVVPGFGGSVLRDPDGTPRWGPAFSDIARGMIRADPLSVTGSPDLAVAGVQRTVTVFPPFALPGYDRLVRQIADEYPRIRVDEVLPGRPRDLRADVVLFPYDFRHGVRPAALRLQAEIELRLGRLSRRDRNRRVIVIGHSMGGLVARYWLGPLGGWADCRALITLATPHRGVPKALDWLVNGVHIGRMQLRRMTEVSRDWQGVYDLLPQYPAILPVGTGDAPGRRRSAIGPLEIGGIAAAGFGERAAAASDMYAEIDKAWRELADRGNAPTLTSVFARGHATPSRIVLADGKLLITKADPEWLPNAGWRGDGTVPAISAAPPELESGGTVLRQVPERHLPMAGTPAVTDLLTACDSEAPQPSFRHLPSRAWLGVAVDNVVAAGDPTTVVAEVLGGVAGEATQMSVRVAGAGGTDNFRCERAGHQWRAELPGQRAGTYSLTVSATRVPGVGQLRCRDVLEVVALP
jgi:pimeloyl-ACP methyl ester carboxylesterase